MPPTTAADARPDEYVHAAALGDTAALAWLYERYADPLRRWLESKTRNRDMADDLAQSTWMKVATSINGYDATKVRGGFEAWLWRIARNELNDQYGRLGRRRETLTAEMIDHDSTDGSESPEDAAERDSTSARMSAELEALSADQSACLIHRFYSGLSLEETASVMGKKVGAIKALQHRAIKALEKRIPDLDPFMDFTPALRAVSHSHTNTPQEVRR